MKKKTWEKFRYLEKKNQKNLSNPAPHTYLLFSFKILLPIFSLDFLLDK